MLLDLRDERAARNLYYVFWFLQLVVNNFTVNFNP